MSRSILLPRLMLIASATVVLPTLFACLDHLLKNVEYDPEIEDQQGIAISINKDVDVLFIVDNSFSMGSEQGNLSRNFANFINVLEREDVQANYRIGVTTTDMGGLSCNSPEDGAMVLSSCRSRLSEFVFSSADTNVDARQEACLDVCDEAYADIEFIPTLIQGSSEAAERPWLESINGVTNLASDTITTVEALQCLGPQGVLGCGYESPLEAMREALNRATQTTEPEFGFLRANAILAIVFVTDEADCSVNNNTLFSDSTNPFWPLDESGNPVPLSSICWDAGVQCTGEGPIYAECSAVDYGPDGTVLPPSEASDEAMLHPLRRYIDFLQEIEDAKRVLDPNQEVLVAAITGVPENYTGGQIVYQDDGSTFAYDFGIATGCRSAPPPTLGQDLGGAVPPVRLREFAEAFQVGDDTNLFSVCDDDYGPALEAIADKIRDQIQPSCMQACVTDVDPTTPELDEECVLTQTIQTLNGNEIVETEIDIPQCENIDGRTGDVPEGATSCYIPITDPNIMDPICVEDGWNLEFQLIDSGEGESDIIASRVEATCQLSQQPAVECPNLPN